MAQEETETITIRLPRALKTMVEEAARARAMTVTSVVREALQDTLKPTARMYQHPGLSQAFDEFVRGAGRKTVVILVIDERTGQRYFFQGTIDANLTNESLLALGKRHGQGWIIPRRDIVAWFEGAAGEQAQLASSLMRQGWALRSSDY